MRSEFEFTVWDVPGYIMNMTTENNQVTDENLENVAGGKMNKKFLASSLLGLTVLTGNTGSINPSVLASETSSTVQSDKIVQKDVTENREFTKEQIIEDINYVLDVIKKHHVSAIDKIPDEVLKQKDIEINNLSEKTSIIEVYRIIWRIVSKLHEAHTMIATPAFLRNRLPFDTEFTDKKFICRSGEFSDYSIVSINDISVEDLYKKFKEHCSHEIDEWTYHNFFEAPSRFVSGSKLSLSGIDISKPIKITFQKNGEIKSKEFNLIPIKSPNTMDEEWVSYEIDQKNNLGIFKLDDCTCNDEYKNKLHNFFLDVQKNNIKNIVVDVRKNYGGASRVIDDFMMYLKNLPSIIKCFSVDIIKNNKLAHYDNKYELTVEDIEIRNKLPLYDGNIYVLTSHGTFSSGMWFAALLSDNNLAKIIGEVPGNSPTSCGDCSPDYVTPNSKISFHTTFKKFYRPDSTKNPDRVIPDFEVPAKDALNKVYEIINEQ